jgi:hypothetical protein
MMEGVYPYTPSLAFSTNNNQISNENNSSMQIFPYLIQENERTNPSYHANSSKIQEKTFRGAHHHHHPFTKRHSPKDIPQERNTKITKCSENFSQVLLTMGELCYEMRSYDLLFIQNVSKIVCPHNIRVNHKTRGQQP